ncbi:hypothetical protein Tco_1307704 [Tanacetum coccineum]
MRQIRCLCCGGISEQMAVSRRMEASTCDILCLQTHKKVDRVLHEIVPQLTEKPTDDLIENNLKPSIPATIIEDCDAFCSEVPDLMKRSLQDQANDIVLWEVLKHKFEKSSTSTTSCRDDDIHSQRHDDYQEHDAPPVTPPNWVTTE